RPPFRIGYLSVLLPADTSQTRVRSMLRQKVIEALEATGEWRSRITIVTSQRQVSGSMTRWLVEYETGPHGESRDPW
ncbi:MAG: hypothetical protein JOZ49_06210, partial [Mycolicibacterium sp.]|nr:hypothetical protein [Mycolicibacterium sp.]